MKIQQPIEAERIIRANRNRLDTPLANLAALSEALSKVGLDKAAEAINLELGTIRHSSRVMFDELFGKKE